MSAPRLQEARESKRASIVGQLPETSLRKDAALERVAETVRVLCDVPMAHVSLMKSEFQCVVGKAGLEYDEYERDNTFCTHTIAEGEVLIVENAKEHVLFADNPFVTGPPELRFYAGLPLIIEDVPVGTLCALDTRPRELDLQERSELFGLVNTIEAHLEAVYEHEAHTPEHALASKIMAGRALATRERHQAQGEPSVSRMASLESELQTALETLAETSGMSQVDLGMVSTAVDEERAERTGS